MQNSGALVPLGWTLIVVSAIAMALPIIRRRGDALTFWNLFLLGGVVFNGLGCLEVVYGTFDWPQLQWFQPTRREVGIYIVGTILFYVTIFVSYYLLAKPIDRCTRQFLNKWPPNSQVLTLYVVATALLVTLATLASTGVFFVGPLTSNISQKVIVFAVVFTFCNWWENKRQPFWLGLFLGVFLYCALFSMVTYTGRRLLMSVVGAPLFCMYWLNWRYLRPRFILAGMGTACVLVLAATIFYSTFRHARSIHGSDSNRSFQNVIDAMLSTNLEQQVEYMKTNSLHFFSQYTVHYSLLTIQLVENKVLEVNPLNSLYFLTVYPIPRGIWQSKPVPAGVRIVNDVLHLDVATNWGLGVVGHCWHEGGYPVVVLYGFLIVVVIHLLDGAMRRYPNNRFLIATLASAAPHVVAWPRGDIGVMSAEIAEAFAFLWICALASRFIFGTENRSNLGSCVPPLPHPTLGRFYQ